jgi:predicted nucleotidyltransferase
MGSTHAISGDMLSRIERVLDSLNRAGVRYLVVGGVAVVLHGYLRVTADLDLVVQLERGNVDRAVRALSELGWRPRAPVAARSFADPDVRRSWIESKGMTVFSLWSPEAPALEVDIFVDEPFDFDETYDRSVVVELDTTHARVVGVDDLIALKQKAGRHQDLADIEALRALSDPDPEKDDRSS